MEEVKTKRGRIGFGEENIILDENYLDYFRNLYRELWVEGEHHHMLSLFILVFVASYGFAMLGLLFLMMDFSQLLVLAAASASVYGAIWVVQRRRGFTTDGKIAYGDISEVEFVEGREWFTCPRFIIRYGDDSKRYISMHSHIIPGVDDRVEKIEEGFTDREISVS